VDGYPAALQRSATKKKEKIGIKIYFYLLIFFKSNNYKHI
jgi:hypothetical protein